MIMENILAGVSVSISEFKTNPMSAVRQAGSRPLAVLSHNKPAFYTMDPKTYADIMELLDDAYLTQKVIERLPQKATAVKVNLDEL